MKQISFLLGLAVIVVLFQSCFGRNFTSVGWYLAIRSNDTVTVLYTCNVHQDKEYAAPIYPDEDYRLDTVRIYGDTVISGSTAIRGGGVYTNIFCVTERESYHDNIEIVFISRESWNFWHFHEEEWSENHKGVLPLDMKETTFWNPIFERHGTILSKNQRSITVNLKDCDCGNNE